MTGLVAVEGAPPMKSSLLSDSVVLLSKYDSLFSRLLSAPFHVHPQSHALHLQSLWSLSLNTQPPSEGLRLWCPGQWCR